MSISSFEAATTILELEASIATAGSFCLFWENGAGGLPAETLTSVGVAAADAAVAPSTSARAAANHTEVLRMLIPLQPNPYQRMESVESSQN
ncbi:MAG: hypothetical protein PVS2B1_16280 [Candidatus Dormibacteraceae bacterium]